MKTLKKIFDYSSRDSKMLSFEEFKKALLKLYTTIFGEKDPKCEEDEQKFSVWLQIDTE